MFSRRHEKLPISPIIKLAKFWTLSEVMKHNRRRIVFQLEILCNHGLDVVV